MTISHQGLTRREFLLGAFTAGALALSGAVLFRRYNRRIRDAETFISKVDDYTADITSVIVSGLQELAVTRSEIKGKRILLKPNLVEPQPGTVHINTHPLIVRGAAEAFLSLGAEQVTVGEGPGHGRDTLRALEASGMGDILVEDRIPFVDLNSDDVYSVPNKGGYSRLKTLTFPVALRQSDLIVSMPKLKTHHWAGVTLSMKNMFGVMPGMLYGWPKNVLHREGIGKCILDINMTLQPHLAIVDGVIGMEGDGPIMGPPRHAGVLVMGRNFVAVDATCSRIMGVDPEKVPYLAVAATRLGPLRENNIAQHGETIGSVRTDFALIEKIPAHRNLLI
ncbi:MAG: DUF362 domain-containing protein [Gammaproteobacteria bacterium]